MAKVWFLGEAVIDFVPVEVGSQSAYSPKCGGSPMNAAVACARQGAETGFLGGLSTDFFGDQLAAFLQARDVDISRAERRDDPTTLAFVELDGATPRYAFFNRESVTQRMSPDPGAFDHGPADILHIGSISLIENPGADNIKAFVAHRARDMLVSFDPNARPGMTSDVRDWRARVEALLRLSNVVKISDEDLDFLSPGESVDAFAARALANGTDLIVYTAGAEGATLYAPDGPVQRPAIAAELVDTVGAGDTVTGTFLANLVELGCSTSSDLRALSPETLGGLLTRALTAAALNCERSGCNPPTRDETLAAIADRA